MKNPKLILILIIISINLLIFLPSLKGGFVWDDYELIVDNSLLKTQNVIKTMFTPFGYGGFNSLLYRPIVSLSYKLDYLIYGLNPSGFHLTNIIIHTLNAILIFFILFYLFKDLKISFISSVVFSVFPSHFENVSWISGRTDLIAMFFTLLTVLFFIKYFNNDNKMFLYFSSITFFLAILSKEVSVLIIILLIYFLFYKNIKFSKAVNIFLTYFITIPVYVFLKLSLTQDTNLIFTYERAITFLSLIGFYFKKLIFPFVNTFSIDELGLISDKTNLILGILVIFILFFFNFKFFFTKKYKNRGMILFSMSILFVLLYSSLLFFENVISIAGFRFLYFPSLFYMIFLILIIEKIINKNIIKNSFYLIIILVFSVNLYSMNKYFSVKNQNDFWKQFKSIDNESIMVKFNYASSILEVNEEKALKIFNNILKYYKGHINYNYYRKEIYETFASYYTNKRDLKKADYYFKKLDNKKIRVDTRFDFYYFLFLKGKKNVAFELARKFYLEYKNVNRVKYFYYLFLKKTKKL